MKTCLYLFFIFCFVGLLPVQTRSQGTTQPNIYTTTTGRERTAAEIETMRTIYSRIGQNPVLNRARDFPGTSSGSSVGLFYTNDQRRLVARLSDSDLPAAAPYKQFLKQSKTGFNTLIKDGVCLDKEAKPSQSAESCLSERLAGRGSHFSFRHKGYVFPGWADLGFTKDWLFSAGYLTQSIFVELGDVPIENVNLQSAGVSFLNGFVPAQTLEEADKQRGELEKGVKEGDFFYFLAVKAVPGRTYALRSIAYQGRFVKVFPISGSGGKVKIDLLEGDERKDVTVVFRVVGTDESGNLQIVWKELQAKSSPKLKVPEQEIKGAQVKRTVTKID
jgi:hypothetical protein